MRARGIAHIPIDDAMQRLAQQGIPDWAETKKSAAMTVRAALLVLCLVWRRLG